MTRPAFLKTSFAIAVVAAFGGALYGLLSYFIFRRSDALLQVSFLFLVPFSMGVIAALLTPRAEGKKVFLNAALSVVVVALTTTLFMFEAALCWLILAPIALIGSSLGAGLIYALRRYRTSARHVQFLASLALVPFMALPLEQTIPTETVYQSTLNSIRIEAPAGIVWDSIKSVPTIELREYRTGWTHRFGLPRPLAATLSHEGVGGVRNASFSSGLSFHERVTDWQPEHTLAFSIEAQGEGLARQAFPLGPEIGGRFVDVISGRYTLEPLNDGSMLLHLSSSQRVSSHLNHYAGFWIDAVMSDLQRSILEVIKARAEATH